MGACFACERFGHFSSEPTEEAFEMLAMAGTGYGLIGLLVIILLVLLIIYFVRRTV